MRMDSACSSFPPSPPGQFFCFLDNKLCADNKQPKPSILFFICSAKFIRLQQWRAAVNGRLRAHVAGCSKAVLQSSRVSCGPRHLRREARAVVTCAAHNTSRDSSGTASHAVINRDTKREACSSRSRSSSNTPRTLTISSVTTPPSFTPLSKAPLMAPMNSAILN